VNTQICDMKTAILCLLLAVTVALASTRHEFVQFQHKYNKVYSADEFAQRYNVFKDNLEVVTKMNEGLEGEARCWGVTEFMDLTPEEFRSKYLMKEGSIKSQRVEGHYTPIDLSQVTIPSAFDWRTHSPPVVTGVYNQGQCGSCWAFSTTENIESMWALAGNTLRHLSMQQIVDCDTNDDGCNGGDPPTAYQYVISAGGMDPLASYPYTGENGYCEFNSGEVVAHISSWAYATQSQNEQNMQAYLVQNGPLSICVDAESWQYYTGGIIMKGSGCGTSLDHCVMATGYAVSSSGTPYWIVRNSWGTSWGENGYLKVELGQDVCGIAQEATSSVI